LAERKDGRPCAFSLILKRAERLTKAETKISMNALDFDKVMARNFADKKVQKVTISIAQRHIRQLVERYKSLLFSKKYKECVDDIIKDDSVSLDNRKARVVNLMRFIRTLTDEEYASLFPPCIKRKEVEDYIGTCIAYMNGALNNLVKDNALEGDENREYVPWTLIYNRAQDYLQAAGDTCFEWSCKFIVLACILDHPPRRNEIFDITTPLKGESEAETRARALRDGINAWAGNRLYLNKYKTARQYGEYVFPLSERALNALRVVARDCKPGARIFANWSMSAFLSHALGMKCSVNVLRHSFLTYYYSHKHGRPVYLHEKNDMATMMANSIAMHDRYVIRNEPYKNDKLSYYSSLFDRRNEDLSERDLKLISALTISEKKPRVKSAGAAAVDSDEDEEGEEEVEEKTAVKKGPPAIPKKTTARRKTENAKYVLLQYRHLYEGKTVDEKRRTKPYLYLSTCEDELDLPDGTRSRVCDVLGGDAKLIKKWVSKL
jgi:hypothetical protein